MDNVHVSVNQLYSYVISKKPPGHCGSIKTHGSESRGQEEAGLRDEPASYLQVALL